MESPHSPEAEIVYGVEDLWDSIQETSRALLRSSIPALRTSLSLPFHLLIPLKSEVAALKMMAGSIATGLAAGGLAAALGSLTLGTATSGVGGIALATAAASGVTTAAGSADSGPDAADSMGGSFFESLTSSDFYKHTKVGDISGSFRWAPFLALQKSDSFLTCSCCFLSIE